MTKNRRSAVVFGGAQGIGFATCRLLANDCDSLTIVDVNKEAAERARQTLTESATAKISAISADITKKSEVAAAREKITQAYGAPSILVNCAAIVDDKNFLDSSEADWDRVLSVCLRGTMNCLHEFLPAMVSGGFGRVVCLASDSAKLGQARLSYYAAAKGGVVALVKSVAQELGSSGVNLNIVSPGATNTEMRRAREAGLLASMGPEKYERRTKAVVKMYPLRRLGEPDDIAASVHFLTTDQASWITGQVLSVNGGFTMA